MKRFRLATPSLILFTALAAAGIAQAGPVINFSTIPTGFFSSGSVDGYTITSSGGYVWGNTFGFPTNSVGSAEPFTVSTFTFTDGGTFDFVSLDLDIGSNDDALPAVTVQGYLSSTLVGTDTFDVPTVGMTPETFDAVNLAGVTIDTLVVTVSSDDAETPLVDNVAFSSTATPEPATMGMLGLGLCGLMIFRSKRKNAV